MSRIGKPWRISWLDEPLYWVSETKLESADGSITAEMRGWRIMVYMPIILDEEAVAASRNNAGAFRRVSDSEVEELERWMTGDPDE